MNKLLIVKSWNKNSLMVSYCRDLPHINMYKTIQTWLQYNPHALSSYVSTYSCRMKAYSFALQQFLL